MPDKFEIIARKVSELAAAVKCSPSEYRDGLRSIIEVLENDVRASEETDA